MAEQNKSNLWLIIGAVVVVLAVVYWFMSSGTAPDQAAPVEPPEEVKAVCWVAVATGIVVTGDVSALIWSRSLWVTGGELKPPPTSAGGMSASVLLQPVRVTMRPISASRFISSCIVVVRILRRLFASCVPATIYGCRSGRCQSQDVAGQISRKSRP